MYDVSNMLKELIVKDVPINSYECLNIQVFPFNVFWTISSGKLQVMCSFPVIH